LPGFEIKIDALWQGDFRIGAAAALATTARKINSARIFPTLILLFIISSYFQVAAPRGAFGLFESALFMLHARRFDQENLRTSLAAGAEVSR